MSKTFRRRDKVRSRRRSSDERDIRRAQKEMLKFTYWKWG